MRGTNKHKKLCSFERDLIGVFLSSGESISQIARSLGRSKSTISDEIRRNSIRNIYLPSQAEDITRYRREKASKKRIKLLKDPKLYSYVMSKLKDDHWSPEEIEGRIEREFINSKSMRISYETIYRFIYRMNNLSLWNYLPRKHKKRKKQNRLIREGKDKIPERISIHERPEKIENRIEFGHFEGDSVIGKRYGSGLHTEVERISRRLFTEKIGRVNSEETIKAQISMFSNIPKPMRKSTTLDNGGENYLHTNLKGLGMTVFFADPYKACQRGSNEHFNGILRRYFPKGTDFDTIPVDYIKEVVEKINNRPLKVLNFKTPNEVWNEEIKKLESVRIEM